MKAKAIKPKRELMKRGRKTLAPEDRKPPQATVKINERILPFVMKLREELKKGTITDKRLETLFGVVDGYDPHKQPSLFGQEEIDEITRQKGLIQNELYQLKQKMQSPIEPDLEFRTKLVAKYDKEHRKVVDLESKVRNLDSDKRALTHKLEQLSNKTFSCQCLTKNGERCTREGKLKAPFHNVEINVCLQHKKALESKS